MGRRRNKATSGNARRKSVEVATGGPLSVLGVVAAALLTLACTIPLAMPGDVYPPGIARFWLAGGIALAIVAALTAMLPFDSVSRLSTLLRRPSPAVFATIVGVTATLLGIVFAVYAFERRASTSDEFAQLWHAHMLVHGRLSLPVDANPEFFSVDNVVDTGRWYSQFPIGGPSVLALGVLFGAPWLVNPVLIGIAAAAMYRFARLAYGETEGRAIAALFCVTPMVLMMSGSYMNHVPVLCLTTCTLAALAEWERATSRRRSIALAALIGLLIGLIATIRPLDAVVVATLVGAFQLTVTLRNAQRVRDLGVQVLAGAIGVAPLLYANWATTGSALTFGYDVLWGPGHGIGFHADPQGTVHTLGRGLQYAVSYVRELNHYVMLWPVPALVLVVVGLLAMRRATRWDVLLLGLLGTQVVAYGAYWFWGQMLGPRFLFTALPAVIVLLARVPFLVGDRFGGFARRAAVLFTLGCIAVSWTPGLPRGVWSMAQQVRDGRRIFKADLDSAVRDAQIHHAVVFLREPFGTRLLHRLWALGMPRSDAAQLLAKGDGCSLLTALRAAESDSTTPRADKPAAVARATAPYTPVGPPVHTVTVHVSSFASITPECKAEFDNDTRYGGATFGPALLLEPINADGRIDGDVIYVVDLGERNELLRARFGDRTWYRLPVVKGEDRTPNPTVVPY